MASKKTLRSRIDDLIIAGATGAGVGITAGAFFGEIASFSDVVIFGAGGVLSLAGLRYVLPVAYRAWLRGQRVEVSVAGADDFDPPIYHMGRRINSESAAVWRFDQAGRPMVGSAKRSQIAATMPATIRRSPPFKVKFKGIPFTFDQSETFRFYRIALNRQDRGQTIARRFWLTEARPKWSRDRYDAFVAFSKATGCMVQGGDRKKNRISRDAVAALMSHAGKTTEIND
jgi:hypothetical protein